MHSGLLRNTDIVFREEFDGWGILFDPQTGNAVALDPVAVFYWKHLDHCHDRRELVEILKKECDDVPADAPQHLDAFIERLQGCGFVSL